MSKIISDNYKAKLSTIIDNYTICSDLSSLVNFFTVEVQRDQKSKCKKSQKVFSVSDIARLEEIKESDDIRILFAYINLIITEFPQQYLHIHINVDLSDNLIDNLTTLFAWEVFVSSSYNVISLKNEGERLDSEINRDLNLIGISATSENKLRRERKGWRHKLKLIKRIMELENSCKKNGVLLNLNTSASEYVNLSEYSVFPEPLNTYVNYGNSLQYIYDDNNTILQNIGTIINLFPAERGTNIWYNDFISENINGWNQLPEFNFNKTITITEGKKTPEALLEMQRQNKFQTEEIYTIFSFEL